MSDSGALPLMTLKRLQLCAIVASIAVAIAVIAGGQSRPEVLARAYLAGYLFVVGLSMGSLALLMLYHLTGGAWGFLVRRILERAVLMLPLVALGFLPISLSTHTIYPFAQAEIVAENELVQFQQTYLNIPYFQARAAIYFALWLLLAWCLLAWSRAQQRTGDARYARWCENLSGPGLVIYGVTMHFASVDWLLSLQPAFHSTIFAPIVVAGQILSAHCLAIVMLALSRRRAPLAEHLSTGSRLDLGNLLLAFLIVWAYLSWFQYMLIWIANLPVDAVWYMPRLRRGWLAVARGLTAVTAIAFVLLLWRAIKLSAAVMVTIAWALLVGQLVFDIYQVAPRFAGDSFGALWIWCAMPVGLTAIWFAIFVGRGQDWSALPVHDANRESALELREADERKAAWPQGCAHG